MSGSTAPPPAPRPARPRSITCPNCGAPITIHVAGTSVTAACPACNSVLDVTDDSVRRIAEQAARVREPLIAIGTRGTLAGTEWLVVGYQIRSTDDGEWSWDEYLLFNPYRGYRFLLNDHGNWTFYAMLRQDVSQPDHIPGDPRRYRAGSKGTARTDYVLGEFYWRVRVGDTVATADFVDAPYVLSREAAGDEITWSRGVLLDQARVQNAFGLVSLPKPTQAVEHAPSGWRVPLLGLWAAASAAVLLLLVVSGMRFGQHPDTEVYRQVFHITDAERQHPQATATFTIPDAGGSLRIGAAANIRDTWVGMDLSLVDQGTGKTYQGALGFEYYAGYDPDDGDWSEGARDGGVTFHSVPGGTYKLLVTPDSGIFTKPAAPPPRNAAATTAARALDIAVVVVRHPAAPWNLVVAACLLLLFPLIASIGRWLRRIGGG